MGSGGSKIRLIPDASLVSDYSGEGPFFSEKMDACAPVRFAKKGVASKEVCPAITLIEMMKIAVKKHKDSLVLIQEPLDLIKIGSDKKIPPPIPLNKCNTWTWQQYHDDAENFAKACIKMGFEQHDACTIFGFNSPYWFISYLGAMFAGGKANGVYPSDTPQQFSYKCVHSNSSIVAVESNSHLKMIQELSGELPYVKAVVVWGDEPAETEIAHMKVMSIKAFLELGKAESMDAVNERISLVQPGHCASLIYTSGTTGQPKAVMMSHDNLAFETRVVLLRGAVVLGNDPNETESIVSYLPLSHIAGSLLDIVCPIALASIKPANAQVYFARPYDLKLGSLVERLKMVHPTMFLGVPRVWEKIQEKMQATARNIKGVKKKISTWAKKKGLEKSHSQQLNEHEKNPAFYGVAEKLVFSKVRAALGLDRCKIALTGAAPILVDTLEYFGSIGININEVYGMSECAGATTWSNDSYHVWGSVGFALDGFEVKIFREGADKKKIECPYSESVRGHQKDECQGEICFRGRHIMIGYMANPKLGEEHVQEIIEKNKNCIDEEGWCHSGDMGVMDKFGMVRITGRYKELIITAGGENIAPTPIENEIKKLAAGVVSNVQMVGDKRKFNVCLITLCTEGANGERPGTEKLLGAAADFVEGVKTVPDAIKNPTYAAQLEQIIKTVNNNGDVCPSNASKIGKFTILPRDFSIETGELTATMKLKRGVTEKANLSILEKMYAGNETDKSMYVPYE